MPRRSSRAAALGLALACVAPSFLAAEAALELRPSGWLAASYYARPQEEGALAAAGLRGGLSLDGWAFEALGFRLSLEAYSNFAGLGEGGAWSLERPDPLSVAGRDGQGVAAALDLKELWLEGSLGPLDIRAGKQLFSWGLADGNNPTDNLNARHVGTRFSSSLDEQKLGALGLSLVYNLPDNRGSLQGLFLPLSIPNDLAPLGLTIPVPSVPPLTIVLEDDQAPGFAGENVEGGLRALFYFGQLSCSVSWLSYLDRYPDYRVSTVAMTTTLSPFHGRVQQFGLDAAWLAGGYDLRTEWALALTEDSEGDDPAVKNSSLSGVVQGSRSFLDGRLSASLAWAPHLVLKHRAPEAYASPGDQYLARMLAGYNGQAYAFEQTGSLRLAAKFFNETFQPEALLLASLEARDWLATASASYNLADGLNLKGGLGIYGSFRAAEDPEREWGLFSNSRTIDKDYLYLELRLSY